MALRVYRVETGRPVHLIPDYLATVLGEFYNLLLKKPIRLLLENQSGCMAGFQGTIPTRIPTCFASMAMLFG